MEERHIPQHIAIILDGNGRWAKAQGMPRSYGHMKGSDNVEVITRAASERGVKYITAYAFSTENWKRPKDEVDTLMKLLRNYMKSSLKKAKENNMRVRVIGDRSGLAEDIVESINTLEEATRDYTGLTLTIALNYGGRDEITRACRSIASKVQNGEMNPCDITQDTVASFLDTEGIPDPDLLIRTSGELRLSNFLLWQLAYAEFYITDVHWPDFNEAELDKAIDAYNKRDRRFGGVKNA